MSGIVTRSLTRRALLHRASQLGFMGAACIHPAQVEPLNVHFAPTADEVARARRVLSAYESAERDGWPVLPFPAHAKLIAPLRQASAQAGSTDYIAAWSGQAGSLARPLPAAELVRVLVDETCEAIDRLRRSVTP